MHNSNKYFLLKRIPGFYFLGFFFFYLAFSSAAQAAFWKKETPKIVKTTTVSDPAPYRVIYKSGAFSSKGGAGDSGKKWMELDYKIVDMGDVEGVLFQPQGGGQVRFMDKDGFVLAADLFLMEDFQKTDYYGSVLIERDRLEKIVKADAVVFREGELEKARKQKKEREQQKQDESKLYRLSAGKAAEGMPTSSASSPSLSTQPIPPPGPSPAENPQISQPVSAPGSSSSASKGEETENSVTVILPQVTMTPPQKEQDKILDLGGTTNEDIEETLSALEKTPPTQVAQSPSSIPGMDSESELKNAEISGVNNSHPI